MDRLTWTDADIKAARRLWAVTTYALEEPEVLPFHLREESGDVRRARHFARVYPSVLPRRAPKHAASEPDDEEPSPAATIRRATTLQRVVVLGIAAGVLLIGFAAFRGLTGG